MINFSAEKSSEDKTEIVERKGTGHPDTFCDLLAETLSLNLSRYYLDHFGFILHHNVDKILLAGGKAIPKFGGGKCTEPIRLFLAGRATSEYHGVKIPVNELIYSSLDKLLRDKFRQLKPEHFEIHNVIRPGSVDLVELFERGFHSGDFLANDSSSGVGYAPLSDLEKIVLSTEQYLNSREIKQKYPEIGEDIKIMGIREGDAITLTAGIAFIDQYLDNIDNYREKKVRVENLISKHNAVIMKDYKMEIKVNTGDDYQNESIFMTVTGTSAESGDDGEVGRGNRPNGLISPYRPMTMEALAGKNPVTHVGKLYNWIAMEIAAEAVKLDEVLRCFCYMVSRIGHPVSKPFYIDLKLQTPDGEISEKTKTRLTEIVNEKLLSLKSFGKEVVINNRILIF